MAVRVGVADRVQSPGHAGHGPARVPGPALGRSAGENGNGPGTIPPRPPRISRRAGRYSRPMPTAAPTAPPLADAVARVRERIAAAAARAGRSADEVTLVAVTKTRPIETVRAAVAVGLTDLGENRVGELVDKSDVLPGEAMATDGATAGGGAVRWHLVGSLQRNKARDAAARADLFHALDSVRLADALDRRAEQAGRVLPVLVQVNVSGEDAKGGVEPDAAHDLLAYAAERPHLRPVGLMGMAAFAEDRRDLEAHVRPAFRRLRDLFDAYAGGPQTAGPQTAGAETAGAGRLSVLSMGMSGDFEVAVEEGATHVRVGTALFGPR